MTSRAIVFSGGPILTMAEPLRAEAMAITGDRILCVGSLEDCRTVAGADRVDRDLAGRTLIPGFVDAHCHPLMLGRTQSWLDVSPSVAPSIAALIARLDTHARRLPPGVPLRAFGYDYRRLDERRHPLARDLDLAATDREIYVMNVSGHAGRSTASVWRPTGSRQPHRTREVGSSVDTRMGRPMDSSGMRRVTF